MSTKSIHHDCDGSIVEWTGSEFLTTDVNLYKCPRQGFYLIPSHEFTSTLSSGEPLYWKNTKLANSDIAVTFFCNEPPINQLDLVPESNIEAIQENNDYD